ncbi:hypothetical protein BJ912DRAFT_964704 [Pholiota molesta]|nr:hypothetical protein BJ912DRAFT_964704 [Pholiota molesta]
MSANSLLNGTYYGPDESATDIFLERGFLAGDFLGGVGYGIQLTLYLSCAMYLWNGGARGVRSRRFLNFPGGPWQYFLSTEYLPINKMFYSTFIAGTFLADLLMLWRCWIILSASGTGWAYSIVAFPAAMILASFVMGIIWAIESTKPGLSLYNLLPLKYGTSYYVLSVSANVILTILITVQLLIFRRRIIKIQSPEHGREYFSLATIMVESAALYSGCGIIFIVTYALNNPLNQIFLFVANSSQQIAGYLIIYRVAQGSAWSRRTFSRQNEIIGSQALRFKNHTTTMDDDFRNPTTTMASENMVTSDTLDPPLKLTLLRRSSTSPALDILTSKEDTCN